MGRGGEPGCEQQEESIYNLLPQQQPVLRKPPMHRSKHPGAVDPAQFGRSRRRGAATMGRADGMNADHPAAFLRSHSKEPVLPAPGAPSSPKHKLKPPVPGRSERPVMGLMSAKDYVTTNAVEVILAAPAKVPQEERLWVDKPTFGKVPTYLARNRATIAAEAAALEDFLKLREQPAGQPAAVPMPACERESLLRHLKLKWAAVNAEYQKLGFVMDIESKIKRREAMERQLADIERDIATLERGDVVLVVHDAGGSDC